MAGDGRSFKILMAAAIFGAAIASPETPAPAAGPNPNPNAILVLGSTQFKHNARGTLSTSPDGLSFESSGKSTTVPSAALEKVTVGAGLREVGGVPMTAVKMAIPYGGGRVVSLFAHEKYDTLTVEYRDENSAYHGLVFRIPKGQADALQAAIGEVKEKPAPAPMSPASEASKREGWAIQIEPLDPKDTAISQEFLVATYEYLVREFDKSHHYVAVLRSGDKNAGNYPKLLVLKTDVQKYVRGNEATRAVTTVKGWTKLGVNMQLSTSDGRSVLKKDVESNVRFYGNNLRATSTLAHSMATIAATAKFPE